MYFNIINIGNNIPNINNSGNNSGIVTQIAAIFSSDIGDIIADIDITDVHIAIFYHQINVAIILIVSD